MTAPPFYLAASDGLPQTTDLGHQHRQGEGTPTESSDPIRYLPHKPPTLSKGLHFSLKKIFFVKQETIGLRGTEMQKSLSKESSRPKVRAQKNPAPGWVPGILGGAAQSPEFLATDKAPPFPIRLQPIRFCQGWLSNLPLLRSSCRWLLSGPSVRSVPGQECWWPSPGPAQGPAAEAGRRVLRISASTPHTQTPSLSTRRCYRAVLSMRAEPSVCPSHEETPERPRVLAATETFLMDAPGRIWGLAALH